MDKDTATLRHDAQEELMRMMDDHLAVVLVGISRDADDPGRAVTSTSLMCVKDNSDLGGLKELTFKETLTGAIQCLVYTALTTLPPQLVMAVLTETIQQYSEEMGGANGEGFEAGPYGPN